MYGQAEASNDVDSFLLYGQAERSTRVGNSGFFFCSSKVDNRREMCYRHRRRFELLVYLN